MLRIYFLKCIDKYAVSHCTQWLTSPRTCSILEIRSILIIRPGGIGDAVLLSPVIRSLKKTNPSVHITVLAEKRNAGVFDLIPEVERLLCYDRPRGLLQALRGSYDAVIDTEQWHRLSAIVARLAPAPLKIGFDTNERRRMFTHAVPYCQDEYETSAFGRLLEPLGIGAGGVETDAPFLTVPDAASGLAENLLAPLQGQPFVTIFPGASIPERRWGADRFRAVAAMLDSMGVKTVVVGGPDDRSQGEAVVAGGAGLNLAGRTTLAGSAAIIRRSSLLLSGDSGVLHIAVGLGVPTVSLFGPGRAKKWAPRGERHIVINKELSCSPCTVFGTTPPCPIKVRCMQEISIDEVFNAVTMLLTGTGALQSRCCKRDWIETAA